MSGAGLFEPSVAGPPGASRRHVDLWCVALPADGDVPPAAARLLSPADRARAARLRSGAAAWALARAALRRVLGDRLRLEPRHVAFVAGADGKPRLAPGAAADVRFSLSHSGTVALIGVRLGIDVGVDVEAIRGDVDVEAVVRETFGPRERAEFEASAAVAPSRREAFFRAWVRREALAKATGCGIATTAAAPVGGWTVVDLDGLPGHAAAVASEGTGWTARLHR